MYTSVYVCANVCVCTCILVYMHTSERERVCACGTRGLTLVERRCLSRFHGVYLHSLAHHIRTHGSYHETGSVSNT